MQTLRLEKGYPLYGVDMTEDYTPFHVGLDRWIKFDKRDFVGREALLRTQERGIAERWVGLVLDSEIPANAGDRIYAVQDIAVFKDVKESGPAAGEQEAR